MKTIHLLLVLGGGSMALLAQPVFTTQPTNQFLPVGSRVLIAAGVSGVGPLTFQWQLNGTNLPNNLITTIAGNGTSGFAGDGGIATTGRIYAPYGVAADISGNVFFADSGNNRIRKVSTDGVMTTVAGSIFGFSGDGGAAIQARLFVPYGVAVDPLGNLYIADTSNNRIRMVDTNGVIFTVAGSTSGFSGDGGAATNSKLSSPFGVNLDANGNLLVADTHNYHVRMIGTNGIITTVAGNLGGGFSGDGGDATNASLNLPQSVTVDAHGNIFIADALNRRVRKVDAYGIITTIAGNGSNSYYSGDGGAATNASIYPVSVAVDNYGDVLIADYNQSRIFQVDPSGIITTIAGTGGPTSYGFNGDGKAATTATLNHPNGVAIDSYGRVLVADTGNNRIRRFGQGPTLVLDNLNATNTGDYTLVVSSSLGSVTSSVATLTVMLPPAIVYPPANQTSGLGSNAVFSVTANGTAPLAYQWQMGGTNLPGQTGPVLNLTNVQWADAGGYQIVITNNYGSITSAVATLTVGVPPSITSQPGNQIVLVGSNGLLSVVAAGDGPFSYQWQFNGTNLPPIITTIAGTGKNGNPSLPGDGGPATNALLNNPVAVAVDGAGNIFIADNAMYRVRRVDTNGIISTYAGTGSSGYTGNGGPATNATLGSLQALTLDDSGNLYIADYGEVRKVATNGVITRVAGTGSLGYSSDGGVATNTALDGASGVAIDEQGNMFICDYYGYRIRNVGTNGIITTVAGITGSGVVTGFSDDGGAATNANLSRPNSVAVDAAGNFYISDADNHRVREVDANGIINTVVGGGSSSGDGIMGTNAILGIPYGVILDDHNNLFVAAGTVQKKDANGVMTTVAGGGSGNPNNNGDYGPAVGAFLFNPKGMAFDSLGNLYIAESSGYRVRKVHFSGDPSLQIFDASVASSGSYSVRISSPFGSTVSSVASIIVAVPPTIQIFNQTNGQLTFTWGAVSNLAYQLQYTTNLITADWLNLGSPITATNSSISTLDIPGADKQRYYRLQLLQ